MATKKKSNNKKKKKSIGDEQPECIKLSAKKNYLLMYDAVWVLVLRH